MQRTSWTAGSNQWEQEHNVGMEGATSHRSLVALEVVVVAVVVAMVMAVLIMVVLMMEVMVVEVEASLVVDPFPVSLTSYLVEVDCRKCMISKDTSLYNSAITEETWRQGYWIVISPISES